MQPHYIHESAIVEQDCVIGEGTKIWHFSHLMNGCRIGKECVVGQNVYIAGSVTIGNGVKIQNNVSLYDGVICEDDVFLGPSCVFTNVINPRSAINRKDEYRKTVVEKGATIGANATIVCGITIGKYALIGAGAVLTKDAPPYSLWVGNPAIQKGWVSESGLKLVFDKSNRATCPDSGKQYVLANGRVDAV